MQGGAGDELIEAPANTVVPAKVSVREGIAGVIANTCVFGLHVHLEPNRNGTGMSFVLDAAFVRAFIEKAGLVQTEICAAARGAHFQVQTYVGELTTYTDGKSLRATHRYSETTTSKSAVSLAISDSSTGTERTKDIEASTEFEGEGQPELIATKVGKTMVRWSRDSSREAKGVRDFLEGNLQLRAECVWTAPAEGWARVEARPTDVRLFGANLSPLPRLASAALWAFLAHAGRAPGTGKVAFDVYIKDPPQRQTELAAV